MGSTRLSSPVFLSHSSKDSRIAMEVVRYLETHGVPCWLSSRDIPPGSDWAETIYNAIAASPAMVLLFTGNSNDSWQVRNELDIATNLKVPIIPVRLDDVEVGKGLRYFTNSHQWIDRDPRRNKMLDSILAAVRGVLSEGTETPASSAERKERPRRLRWAILASLAAVVPALLLVIRGTSGAEEPDLMNLVAGGTDSWDYATDVLTTEDGGFLAAGTWDWGFWSETWVARFDGSGDLLWSWSDSLSGECTPLMTSVAEGGVITAFAQYADFEHTGYWVCAVRLDSLGEVLWEHTERIDWPGAVQPELESMQWDNVGMLNLAFTLRTREPSPCPAVHLIELNPSDGSMTWDTIPGCKESCAYLPIPSGGAYNIYLDAASSATGIMRISGSGIVENSVIVGDQRTQAGCAGIMEDEGLLVCFTGDAYGAGNGDLLIMEFSPDLELLWQRTYGGDLSDGASEVIMLPDGNILVAGSTMSFGDGSADGWVLLLDHEGELIWQTVIDMGGSDRLYGAAVCPDGSFLAAGSTTRYGDPDAWLVGISSDGSFRDSVQLGLDLMTEDWQCGFLDQTVWLMCRSRNYSPSLLRDSTGSDVSIDLNGVPLLSRNAFRTAAGLCLSAEVSVTDLPSASGNNFVSMGLTGADAASFQRDPVAASRAELRWTYTEGISGQLRTVTANCDLGDSLSTRTESDSALVEMGRPVPLLLEICSESVRFWLGDSLFAEAPVGGLGPDSVRVFLNGNSDSAPHRLDDVRVWRRRW